MCKKIRFDLRFFSFVFKLSLIVLWSLTLQPVRAQKGSGNWNQFLWSKRKETFYDVSCPKLRQGRWLNNWFIYSPQPWHLKSFNKCFALYDYDKFAPLCWIVFSPKCKKKSGEQIFFLTNLLKADWGSWKSTKLMPEIAFVVYFMRFREMA